MIDNVGMRPEISLIWVKIWRKISSDAAVINISAGVPIDQQRTTLRLGQLHLFDEFDSRGNCHLASSNG
jgi:hypothetical protein